MIHALSLWIVLTGLAPAPGDSIPAGSAAVMPRSGAVRGADSSGVLAAGDRVRITRPSWGERPLVGRLVSVSGDTLRVRVKELGGIAILRIDDQTLVERSAEHHSHLLGGAIAGALVGGLVGASIVNAERAAVEMANAIGELFDAPPAEDDVSSAPIFLGLVAGGLLGAAVGNAMSSDKWVPASVPAHISLRGSYDPVRGLRVAFSLSPRLP